LWFLSDSVNPFANIITSLKVGKEDLKYYDLTKLEDPRYGKSVDHVLSPNYS